MSKFGVNSVCDRLHRMLKLSKKITPHLLRHTYATHLHLKGQPIEHINALLGHESMNTTKIYVAIDAGKLRTSVEQLYK
ncbi:MAG: tyrosine-type recombinase/integrase [Acidobacteriota bacterium]